MLRKTHLIVVMVLLLVAAAGKVASAQQAEQQPEDRYVIVDCMKSTSSDYADLETEVWKPIHTELIRQGKKEQWAFYWVLFGDRSVCDYYTTNIVTHTQLNDDTSFREAFDVVHSGKDYDEIMRTTAASREMVWSQLWRIADMIPPQDFDYVQVNQMAATDADDYVSAERDIFKAVHAALVKDGVTGGWGLYELVSPHGSSIEYNFATADFLKSLDTINWNTYLRKAHPDQDVDTLSARMDRTRDMRLSEVWLLMDRTTPGEE